ncbi:MULTISPECIES: hypothetical protein [unclassified Halobacteriovorax]|uniref:hypothetical protein n=1 Tax=unclassified Halobacteriovorax TaxID=2639665 RepID=UPI000EA29E8E|nr:hypothetical protein [Halobacteriovorax sp. BALOs_7]AYF43700.1 hypothetical protein BALOs_0689 [Halobacteriovorax sp. BALOs_7]
MNTPKKMNRMMNFVVTVSIVVASIESYDNGLNIQAFKMISLYVLLSLFFVTCAVGVFIKCAVILNKDMVIKVKRVQDIRSLYDFAEFSYKEAHYYIVLPIFTGSMYWFLTLEGDFYLLLIKACIYGLFFTSVVLFLVEAIHHSARLIARSNDKCK